MQPVFRPIQPADMAFLYTVYASTRREELAVTGWNEQQQHAFLTMQFQAQHTHYQNHYHDATYSVIMLGDVQAGRLYVQHNSNEIRIIDIALLPEYRNQGIGGAILRAILQEAEQCSLPVSIHVEQNNPALRLYRRLGFCTTEARGVYLLMHWRSPQTRSEEACSPR